FACAAAPDPAALEVVEEELFGVEACEDLVSSSCAFFLEVATAPRAFSTSWPRLPRLEAEPPPVAEPALPCAWAFAGAGVAGAWTVRVGAEELELGSLGLLWCP